MSAPAHARRTRGAGVPLVQRDFAAGRTGVRRAAGVVVGSLVGAAVALGLAMVALRSDMIRMRYALAAAMREERDLLQERRELVAQLRSLRDPARLAGLARGRGFVRPERVLELGAPGGAVP